MSVFIGISHANGRELKSLYYGNGPRGQINLDNRLVSAITCNVLHQEISCNREILNTKYVGDKHMTSFQA